MDELHPPRSHPGGVHRPGFMSAMFTRTDRFTLTDEGGWIGVQTVDIDTRGMKLGLVRSTGHLVDLTEEDAVTLLFPRAGRLKTRVLASEFRITPRAGFLFAPNSRRTRAERPAGGACFEGLVVLLPSGRLRSGLEVGSDLRRLGMSDAMPLAASPSHARRLADLLDASGGRREGGLPALADRAKAGLSVLLEELMVSLLSETAQAGLAAVPAAEGTVRRAEEIMRARSDDHLSIAELAREVGVGMRSLQAAFVRARAMGPRDVLNRMRLERVRDRLRAPDPAETVTTIALDCGFAHLGRFSGAYREAFGEHPSQTIARARRRAS